MYRVCFTCLGRLHSYSSFEQGGIKSFSSYQVLSSDCLTSASFSSPQCCLLLPFTVTSMLTALLISLTACLPCSRGLTAQDLLLPLTPILSTSLMQELTSILILSSLSLVNSGTLCLPLYFHLPMTWTVSRERYQDTYPILLEHESGLSRDRHQSGLFCFICVALGRLPFYIKKNTINKSYSSIGSNRLTLIYTFVTLVGTTLGWWMSPASSTVWV